MNCFLLKTWEVTYPAKDFMEIERGGKCLDVEEVLVIPFVESLGEMTGVFQIFFYKHLGKILNAFSHMSNLD